MAKFRIDYDGFMYVEADSIEEAEQKYFDGDYIYDESGDYEISEVSDFIVDFTEEESTDEN